MSEIGIESRITCELADPSLEHRVQRWSERTSQSNKLNIIHYSHGSPVYEKVLRSGERKVLLYHNVTPAAYFRGTHPNLARASELGMQQLRAVCDTFETVVAHSTFSARQLESLGFHDVEVMPYVTLPSLYEVEPDANVMREGGDPQWVNIICVAQVSPHKCIEDCILVFDYFKRFLCKDSRLIIIGGAAGTEAYLGRLQRLIKSLHLRDVVFTGQVSMAALVAYYKTAQAFLCMSEHEGFGVPLIEAMQYDIPIFAYNSTAIPETLRGSGMLFPEKHWPTIGEAMAIVLSDGNRREEVLEAQRKELQYYSWAASRERFRQFFEKLGVDGVEGE